MKRIKLRYQLLIITICVLSSLFIIFLQLIQRNPLTTRPITTMTIPTANDIGMDYYHESMDYLWRTNQQIDSDLSQIRQVTHKIKVYHNPFVHTYIRADKTHSNALEVVKNIVRRAKAQHMYVVWTENDDTLPLTDALWPDYVRNVIADAAQARSVGADEFLVGNEISNHNNGDRGYNNLSLPARIKQLVTACAANFPGAKGYEDGWYTSDSWHTAKLGPLHKIYFTLYEPWHTFKNALDQIVTTFGNSAEIGEISTMTTLHDLHDDEQAWTRDLMRRYNYAAHKHVSIWLFTFREIQDNSFGLIQSSSPFQTHDIWKYLTRHKTLTYYALLSNDFKNGTTQSFTGDGYNYHNRLRAHEFNAQVIAQVPIADYVFRGIAHPVSTSSSLKWRAMRLVFRYLDTNNYYFVNIEPNNNSIQLFRRQNGQETSLGDISTPLRFGIDYDFEIRVHSSGTQTSIQIFWDTVRIFNLTDPGNTTLSHGAIGMKNNGVTGELADIHVTSIEQQ